MAAQSTTRARRSRPPRKGSLGEGIISIIKECKARKGTSVPGIKKALRAKGVDVEKCNYHIKTAINSLRDQGVLCQVTGNGACGSFKLAKTKEPKPSRTKRSRRKPGVQKPATKKSAGPTEDRKTTRDKKVVKAGGGKKTVKAGGVKKKAGGVKKAGGGKKAGGDKAAKKVDKKKPAKSVKKSTPKKKSPVKRSGPKKSTTKTTTTKKSRK